MTLSDLQRLLRPLSTRVANLARRAVVSLVDDSLKMQALQLEVLEGETRGDIERFQNYGFTSKPKSGAEALVIFLGGRTDHGIAVAVDDRTYRLKNLADGEVALYDSTGSKAVLKSNGDIELTPSSGTVKVIGDVVAGSISLKNHAHTVVGVDSTTAPVTFTPTGKTGAPV